MKNIFLLLGAHNGSLLAKIDNATTVDKIYGEHIVWDEIHMYEPQTEHEISLQYIAERDARVIYHKQAASNYTGKATFYVKGAPHMGYCSSTLDDKKFAGELYGTLEVEVVDIIDWIRNNTSANDFIVIDMDIECEEYNLLPAIINSDIIDRIHFISVEFHNGKSTRWSANKQDEQIASESIRLLGKKFLDHNQYYG
jgi:FkbM family methyltransferase